MAGVLDGIRVLDLGRVTAGPYCCMLLADLGAEVVRVERPSGGEDRVEGHLSRSGDNYGFISKNRNKKDITLSFERNDTAKEILKELVKRFDVVLQNFSPRAAEAMGITYDNLKTIKPDIILANISAFGPTGPYRDRLGFDPIAQAMSGAMAISGFPDSPTRCQLTWVDNSTAALTALAILAALYHRQRTGQGQNIDTSLLDTAVSFMAQFMTEWETGGVIRERQGNRASFLGPTDLYKTKDGRWVYISTAMDPIWRRFCKFIGREELATDPRFNHGLDRWEHRDILDPIVKEWVASQTAEEVFTVAQQIPIPCGICYSHTEVAHDPHIKEAEMLTEVPFPDGSKALVGAHPIRMSATPLKIQRSFPALGEHNEEIYCGLLGYSREDLAKLKEEGVI